MAIYHLEGIPTIYNDLLSHGIDVPAGRECALPQSNGKNVICYIDRIFYKSIDIFPFRWYPSNVNHQNETGGLLIALWSLPNVIYLSSY